MKFLVFLSILILCTACLAQDLPVAEASPALDTAQPSLATSEADSASTTTPIATATLLLPSSSLTPIATPTLLLPTPSPTPIFDVVIDNVVVDQQGQLYASGFGKQDNLRHYAQWDGAKWIELGNGFPTAGNTLVTDSKGHLYTEILTDSELGMATAMMRWDGDKWEDITGNFSIVVDALQAGRLSGNIPVMALAVDREDNLYAAGSFFYPSADNTAEWAMGYVAKWNKDSWSVLDQGFDKVYITAMETGATGNLYVSGEQPLTPQGNNSFIAHWDNDTWTEIKTSKLINTTQSIAVDRSGRLYANSQGTVIAYWDGADWITIPIGGEALGVNDMAVGRSDHLCIGGSFESVNSIPARNIACWDGSSWYALGEGVNERVNALAFDPDGDLTAVGYFTEAGGLPADHAARWDGKKWHTLGP